jgi:hypothetical protein
MNFVSIFNTLLDNIVDLSNEITCHVPNKENNNENEVFDNQVRKYQEYLTKYWENMSKLFREKTINNKQNNEFGRFLVLKITDNNKEIQSSFILCTLDFEKLTVILNGIHFPIKRYYTQIKTQKQLLDLLNNDMQILLNHYSVIKKV